MIGSARVIAMMMGIVTAREKTGLRTKHWREGESAFTLCLLKSSHPLGCYLTGPRATTPSDKRIHALDAPLFLLLMLCDHSYPRSSYPRSSSERDDGGAERWRSRWRRASPSRAARIFLPCPSLPHRYKARHPTMTHPTRPSSGLASLPKRPTVTWGDKEPAPSGWGDDDAASSSGWSDSDPDAQQHFHPLPGQPAPHAVFQQPLRIDSFSYGPNRTLHFDDRAKRNYVAPPAEADLGSGFERAVWRKEKVSVRARG